ncbi:hypothetical protein CWS31_000255 [Colwellia echini]|uniref:YrhK domain-containing protein n=1 Tax=Colwellia echini TaxID=1982103 RepID=A0ABY3N1U8_9GAMM|nr:hypothetical protein CWS31_000255 [Colwellia echini]
MIGPWPFITRRIVRLENGLEQVWRSRHHRKGLLINPSKSLNWLWMPNQLNWWIGVVFALGSLLFFTASLLWLVASKNISSDIINAMFFAGSIPFTTAAYLQLYQTANAIKTDDHKPILVGWQPNNIGWLSCILQFAGTLLFNINTFDGMMANLTWWQQDFYIWIPNILGSVLFLLSGYLAYAETCHSYWGWKPKSLSWWITLVNLMGCVAFLISALFAFVPQQQPSFNAEEISVVFTMLGALGFFIGSILMLPEGAVES